MVSINIGNVIIRDRGIITDFCNIKLTKKKIKNKNYYTIIIPIPDRLKNNVPKKYRKNEYKKFMPNGFKYEKTENYYDVYEKYRCVIKSDKQAKKLNDLLKKGITHQFLTYNSSIYKYIELEIKTATDFDEAISEYVAKKI